MKCREIAEKLSVYADGELTRGEMTEVRAHVEECHDCREYVGLLEALQSKTRNGLREKVESQDLTDSVMTLLPAPRRATGRLVWAWVLAVCVIVAAVTALYFRMTGPTASKPTIAERPTQTAPARSEPGKLPAKSHVLPGQEENPAVVEASTRRSDRLRIRKTVRIPVKEPPSSVPTGGAPLVSLADVEIAETPIASYGNERRSAITATIKIGDIAFTQRKEKVVVTVLPDKDAPFIQRPPLEIVVKAADAKSFDGS